VQGARYRWPELKKGFKKEEATKQQKQFWDDSEEKFRFPLVTPTIPRQIGGRDCGIFPIAYAKIIPTMKNALSISSWGDVELPSQEHIVTLRKEYFSLYLHIMNNLPLHTVSNTAKESIGKRRMAADSLLSEYLEENGVTVGGIGGDGDCFLNAIKQSAIYELNRRKLRSDEICRMETTMVREQIVTDMKVALREE